MLSVPADGAGVEAFDTVGAGIAGQPLVHLLAQEGDPLVRLDLDHQGDLPVHHLQELVEGGDGLVRSEQMKLTEFCQRAVRQVSPVPAHPLQAVVVEDDQPVVFRDVDVRLDPKALLHRRPERRQAVFRPLFIPQPPVGVQAFQPFQRTPGHAGGDQEEI